DYVHYANLLSPNADPSSPLYLNPLIGKSNNSMSVLGVPAMVGDYYSNNRGAAVVYAFTSASDTYAYGNTTGQGDNYLPKLGFSIVAGNNPTPAANFATTVQDVTGSTSLSTSFEGPGTTIGYKAFNGGTSFNGYTVGPRYWGKTFFI